jgi:hypothetical protein
MSEKRDSYEPDYNPQSPAEAWKIVLQKAGEHSTAITVIATVIMAFTTIFYTVFAGLQWTSINQQTTISRKNLIVTQRAFVYLDTLAVIFSPQGDPIFQARWQNSGTTPATSVRQYVNSDWRSGHLPKGFAFADKPTDPSMDSAPVDFYVAPHGTVMGSLLKVPRTQLESIGKGQSVNFWGWATYQDAFGCRHETKFCLRVMGFDSAHNEVLMTPCPEHNCADEDCKDYTSTPLPVCKP